MSGHFFTHPHACTSIQPSSPSLPLALPHSILLPLWGLEASAGKLLPTMCCDRRPATMQLLSGFCSPDSQDGWGRAAPGCRLTPEAVTPPGSLEVTFGCCQQQAWDTSEGLNQFTGGEGRSQQGGSGHSSMALTQEGSSSCYGESPQGSCSGQLWLWLPIPPHLTPFLTRF